LHLTFAPHIYKLAEAATRRGKPILAPLWYCPPEDVKIHVIMDLYILGDDVGVALVQRGSQVEIGYHILWKIHRSFPILYAIEILHQSPII
jgi:alpha-glucosidase (family GH31 glycosyl hydrolase)